MGAAADSRPELADVPVESGSENGGLERPALPAGQVSAHLSITLTFLIFLLTLVTSSCVTTWKNTTITFTVLDVGTTTYAIHNGYNELNPVTGNKLILTYVINACFLYALDATLKEDDMWILPALLKVASTTWNIYILAGGSHAEQGNTMQTRSTGLSIRQLHPGLLRGHRAYSLKQE